MESIRPFFFFSWLNCFLFSLLPEDMIQLDEYVFKWVGEKPPLSFDKVWSDLIEPPKVTHQKSDPNPFGP